MTLVPDYIPTDWVDNVTPVDEAHMDKLDTAVDVHANAINGLDTRVTTVEGRPVVPAIVNGKWIKGVSGAMVWSDILQSDVSGLSAALTAKQDTSAKGAVNGYAGLDSGGKVPAAQLPTPIDLRWAGAYSAATAYKEGDVVISGGIAYMALRPSTGETPVAWSTGGTGAITYASAVLSADVAGSATVGQWADVLSVALAAGTWLVVCSALSTQNSAGAGYISYRLWDGTTTFTVFDSMGNIGASAPFSATLSALVVAASAITLRLSIVSGRNGGAMARAAGINVPVGNNATQINAVKLA